MAEEKKKNTKKKKVSDTEKKVIKKDTTKKNNTKNTSRKNSKKDKVEKEVINEPIKKESKNEIANDAIENETSKVKDVVNEIYSFDDTKTNNSSKRNYIIIFLIGVLVGLLIMMICGGKRIAKLANGEEVIANINDKNITANDLYNDMKKQYTINLLLNIVDNVILTDLYPEDNDMKTEINEMADYYISMYESYYGYTEEQFLDANNFKNRDEFLDALKLDYRRNKYYEEYVKNSITEKEINDFYNNNVFGEIETKYISISKDNESALDLANEIINKLNNGSTYNDITSEYGERIKTEDLGYVSFKNELEEAYINALKSLDNYTYSVNPVEVSNNYMIIFRSEAKDKETLENVKNDIIDVLSNKKKQSDQSLAYKALIEMRKDKKLSILDEEFAKKYDEYIKEYTNEE